MAEFPALPLFTDAYLADTRHLTTLQHGAYLLMLMTAWRSTDCCLKNDDDYLSRITGIDRRYWHHHKETLLAFWQLNDAGCWVQLRLLDERYFVKVKRVQQSSAGKASALKRLNRGSTSVEIRSNETSTPTPTPTPTPNIRKEYTTYIPKEKSGGVVFPDDFSVSDATYAVACQYGFTDQVDIEAELRAMRDWSVNAGAKGKKKDWQAFARNWFKNNATKEKKYGKNTIADGFAKVRATIAELKRQEDEASIIGAAGVRREDGPQDDGLLP